LCNRKQWQKQKTKQTPLHLFLYLTDGNKPTITNETPGIETSILACH